MVQKIALVILMIPFSLNGLWMLCERGSSSAPEKTETSANSQGPRDCTTICTIEKAQQTGAICLLSPGDNKASITIYLYGVGIPIPSFTLVQPPGSGLLLPERSSLYLNPGLPRSTPPPRA